MSQSASGVRGKRPSKRVIISGCEGDECNEGRWRFKVLHAHYYWLIDSRRGKAEAVWERECENDSAEAIISRLRFESMFLAMLEFRMSTICRSPILFFFSLEGFIARFWSVSNTRRYLNLCIVRGAAQGAVQGVTERMQARKKVQRPSGINEVEAIG